MARLRSNAILRVVDLIGEGPIGGLCAAVDSGDPLDAPKSVYFDDTQLMSDNGSLNFDGVVIDQRFGFEEQDPLSGPYGIEVEESVNVEILHESPAIVRTIEVGDIDDLRIKIKIPTLFFVNDEGDMVDIKVGLNFEIKPFGGEYAQLGTVMIRGKSMSAYIRSYLFENIAQYGARPWDFRITRLTNDWGGEKRQGKTIWDSYTRITREKLSMPDSAVIGCQVSSRDFGDTIPDRAYEIYGRNTIKIPTNYNPVTRTYSGIWDGTFKEGYTNNPAWVFYDMCNNPRYGLSSIEK